MSFRDAKIGDRVLCKGEVWEYTGDVVGIACDSGFGGDADDVEKIQVKPDSWWRWTSWVSRHNVYKLSCTPESK